MTEKQADDSKANQKRTDDNRETKRPTEREQLAAELSCTKLEAYDRVGQRRKDSWEAVNKALYSLMVGHAAGLVGCLTLLKDYNATSPRAPQGAGGVHLAVRAWIVLGHSFRIGLDFRTLSLLDFSLHRRKTLVRPPRQTGLVDGSTRLHLHRIDGTRDLLRCFRL